MKDFSLDKAGKALLITCFLWQLTGCAGEGELPSPPESPAAHFISVSQSTRYTVKEFASKTVGSSLGISLPLSGPDVRVDVIHYHTVSPDEQAVVASGIVAYPVSEGSGEVLLAEHFTISAQRDAPSEVGYVAESVFALFGYVVLTPDYLGFGVSKDLPHPYLHVESTARVSLDFLFAVREYMEIQKYPLKDEIYLAGYSQGGAAALAVQQLAEESYAGEVRIKKVIAGGVPYDLAAIFRDAQEQGEIARPCMLAMTFLGLDYGDKLQLDYSQVFTGDLLTHYAEWISSKDYTTDEIDSRIGTNALADFLHPAFFASTENTNEEFRKLYASTLRNSLTDWTPRAPLVLIHGTKDELAPFYCAQSAYASFKEKGCDVNLHPIPNQNHTGSATGYALQLLLQLNIL
jgi:pimeloyl-ACP methyl ester carboxylesterase